MGSCSSCSSATPGQNLLQCAGSDMIEQVADLAKIQQQQSLQRLMWMPAQGSPS